MQFEGMPSAQFQDQQLLMDLNHQQAFHTEMLRNMQLLGQDENPMCNGSRASSHNSSFDHGLPIHLNPLTPLGSDGGMDDHYEEPQV